MRYTGAMAVALLLLAGCGSAPPDAEPMPGPTAASVTPAASPTVPSPLAALTVGTCTASMPGEDEPAETVPTVGCTDSHAWEVAAVVPLTEPDYPGEAALKTIATAACTRAFRTYVGVDVAASPYDATFVAPGEVHWSNAAARELVCLVGTEAGGLKKSLKDSPVVFAEEGQCLGAPASGSSSYPVVACSASHLYEVYASSTFSGSKAPTETQLDRAYDKTCLAGFTKFVGVRLAKSKYEIQYFVLPESLWSKYSDHRLVCTVGSPSGGITGSLKGAKK